MDRKILIFLFLIILSNYTQAIRLSLAPAHLYFSGEVNKEICQEITLSSDKETTFTAQDKWSASDKSENFQDYNSNASDLGLKVSYQKEISPNNSSKICLSSANSGSFYGIILYKAKTGATIGSLIQVDIRQDKSQKKSINAVIGLSASTLTLMLALTLIFIFKKYKKSNYPNPIN